jgi:hypothetical protein
MILFIVFVLLRDFAGLFAYLLAAVLGSAPKGFAQPPTAIGSEMAMGDEDLLRMEV